MNLGYTLKRTRLDESFESSNGNALSPKLSTKRRETTDNDMVATILVKKNPQSVTSQFATVKQASNEPVLMADGSLLKPAIAPANVFSTGVHSAWPTSTNVTASGMHLAVARPDNVAVLRHAAYGSVSDNLTSKTVEFDKKIAALDKEEKALDAELAPTETEHKEGPSSD